MRSSDVLARIHAGRGRERATRPGSDRALVATATLVDYDGTYDLATVSLYGGEAIAGVPAVPSTYTGVTTVRVLLDAGRPVQVLGPASTTAVPDGTTADTPATEVRTFAGVIVGPVGSGTYRVDRSAWDRWNTTSYGGASDVYQAGSAASGVLHGLAWYGDQILNLGAAAITRARLTLVSNGSGTSATWSATVRGCASGTRPAGAPTYTGSTVSVTVPGYGKAGQAVAVDLDATMCDDLRDGTIKSLGLTAATYGGTYGLGRAPGWYLSLDGTVEVA